MHDGLLVRWCTVISEHFRRAAANQRLHSRVLKCVRMDATTRAWMDMAT